MSNQDIKFIHICSHTSRSFYINQLTETTLKYSHNTRILQWRIPWLTNQDQVCQRDRKRPSNPIQLIAPHRIHTCRIIQKLILHIFTLNFYPNTTKVYVPHQLFIHLIVSVVYHSSKCQMEWEQRWTVMVRVGWRQIIFPSSAKVISAWRPWDYRSWYTVLKGICIHCAPHPAVKWPTWGHCTFFSSHWGH